MTDPIRLPVSLFHRSPPAVTKIKRGGTGKISNSGNAAGRFHTPIRQLRSTKDGKQIPWRSRGAVIWDPSFPVPPRVPRVKREIYRLIVTAPRPDPIYARRRELHAQGLSRSKVREAMAEDMFG